MRAAIALLSQRLADVADVHLRDMLASASVLRRLSPEFTGLMLSRRETIQAELTAPVARERLASAMADGMTAYMIHEHQFVDLVPTDGDALRARYQALVVDMADALAFDGGEATRRLELALQRHHDWLREWVANLLADAGALTAIRGGAARTVCAEYDPRTQLRILGVTAEDLAEPILDIGCGESAALVRHLLRSGHRSVTGIDQSAPREANLIRGSWFDLPLASSSWGTVIAHQSFTLHFLHAHIRSEARAAEFARTFMAILAALQPGGRFLYAPGLPFFERHLDRRQFGIATRAISLPSGAEAPASLGRALEGQPLGARAITRLR